MFVAVRTCVADDLSRSDAVSVERCCAPGAVSSRQYPALRSGRIFKGMRSSRSIVATRPSLLTTRVDAISQAA
ncbi:hypothetical protein KWS_0114755 [Xanthomonas vasicola pv. musacearum NCPPB 4384]|nr:hypothetical protein KWS_0114755 [Xanthomonas vasicola pv. musacearum NCPPB 4384]